MIFTYFTIVIFSNGEVVPDEDVRGRRYCYFGIGDRKFINDREGFFEPMRAEEWDNLDKLQLIYQYFRDRDVSDWNPSKIPDSIQRQRAIACGRDQLIDFLEFLVRSTSTLLEVQAQDWTLEKHRLGRILDREFYIMKPLILVKRVDEDKELDYQFTIETEFFYRLFQYWFTTVSTKSFKTWDKKTVFLSLERYLPTIFNKKELQKTSRAFNRKYRVQFKLSELVTGMVDHVDDFHCDFQHDVLYGTDGSVKLPSDELDFQVADKKPVCRPLSPH